MMTYNSDSKCFANHNQKPHSFPSMDGACAMSAEGSDDIRDCFKPLFRDGCVHDAILPQGGLGTSQADENQNSEEYVRQLGFDQGRDAGRQEACRLTQQAVAPEIKAFATELHQLNEYLVRNEEYLIHQIQQMAAAIAKNILGGTPRISAESLSAIEAELKVQLVKFYQFKLMLSTEEMDAFSRIMAHENPRWQNCSYIHVGADPQVQNGSVQPQPGLQTISADGAWIQSLDNMLAKVSTK